jgi:hypothetical protein
MQVRQLLNRLRALLLTRVACAEAQTTWVVSENLARSHAGMKRIHQLQVRRIPVPAPPDPIGRSDAPPSCDRYQVGHIARRATQVFGVDVPRARPLSPAGGRRVKKMTQLRHWLCTAPLVFSSVKAPISADTKLFTVRSQGPVDISSRSRAAADKKRPLLVKRPSCPFREECPMRGQR